MTQDAENLGPVKVEEQSREILTASSNVLEASKETTSPYIEQGIQCETLVFLTRKQTNKLPNIQENGH